MTSGMYRSGTSRDEVPAYQPSGEMSCLGGNIPAVECASVMGLMHDLAQSTTAIKGWVTILRKSANEPDSSRRIRRLSALEASVRQTEMLLGQVQLLLDSADGKQILRCQPTDIVKITNLVADDFSFVSDRQITVSSEVPTLVGDWDPLQLDRVMRNLLHNAVKYSPSDSEITVTVRTTSRERGNAQANEIASVTVHNDGPGIRQHDLPHVFDLFYRGLDASEAAHGLGIGLTVVQEIVALHGGDVTVDSHAGTGATFTIRLPVHRH